MNETQYEVSSRSARGLHPSVESVSPDSWARCDLAGARSTSPRKDATQHTPSARPALSSPLTPSHPQPSSDNMSKAPDVRFAKLHTDPRFGRPKASKNKIVVDERFKQFFEQREHPTPARPTH